MQKKDSELGITLLSLVLTIVVLLILLATTFSTGAKTISENRDNVLESEIYMVQQAVVQQYMKARISGEIGKNISGSQPNVFVGSRKNLGGSILGIPVLKSSPSTYDESYYELTPEDLISIGIHEAEDTYIVNYSTGEVYNITSTKSNGNLPYIKPNINNQNINTSGDFSGDITLD